jgi:hypothetical protein
MWDYMHKGQEGRNVKACHEFGLMSNESYVF